MRRLASLYTALTLLAIASASAQKQQGAAAPLTRNTVSIGPFAGIDYTTFSGADASSIGASSRADFAIGGQLDYSLGGIGFLRTGLLYSRRGAEGSDQGVQVAAKLSYIEVPVLLGYSFSSSGSGVRPFLMAGGHVAFKAGSTCEETDSGVTTSSSCEDAGFDLSSTDFAVLGGGGVLVPFGASNLSLDVRYALGLKDVANGFSAQNRGFTFGVAYMFPLGR
jgi:hypothetical protein